MTEQQSNIHTLSSVRTTSAKPRGQYPKSKAYHKSIKFWYGVAEANEDIGKISVMPTQSRTSKRGVADIRDENGEVIAWGARTQADRPSYQLWSNAKMEEWRKATKTRPAHIETGDYGLAINVSGGIGVLDFDSDKDWAWFNENFHIDLSQYIVCSNVSGEHNADGTLENTYHLYFKKTDFFNVPTGRVVRCIYDSEGDERQIDFLQQASTGTPQVVKIPTGEGNRKLMNYPQDKIIRKLPAEIIAHFKQYWRKTKAEENTRKRAYKYIDLVNCIPRSVLADEGKRITKLYLELYGVGVDCDTITALAIDHLKDIPYVKCKHGAGRDYTIEETQDWIETLCANYERDSRATKYIQDLAKEHNIGDYTKINMEWLNRLGNHFDTSYLQDVKYNIQDPTERGKYVSRYYNKFFIITTGLSKNRIYYRKYDSEGGIVDIKFYQNKADFADYCGIGMVLTEGGKEVDTASWWFKQKSVVYDKVVFKPYGIMSRKHKISYDTFNAFTGYKMKYVPKYSKPEFDYLGDIIDKHLREVLCWDNKSAGGVNVEFYNYCRAWFYKQAVLGERTHVALIFYSKEKGTGKSMFFNGYRKFVIGDSNALLNANFSKMIKDTFTDYYENLCLLIIEEMPDNSTRFKEAWDFLKALTTEDTMTSRKFQTAPDKMDLFLSTIILTNHLYAIDGDFASRRASGNRVGSHMKDNTDHFDLLHKATDSYEGWENWVHRYLIQKYHEFSHVNISPTEALIPNTQFRKQIMRRGNDTVLYFLKDLLERMEDPTTPEDPYKLQYGKHLSVAGLWDMYKTWRSDNNITTCYLETIHQFVKDRLVMRYEFKLIDTFEKHSAYKASIKDGANVVRTYRSRRGQAIIFDKDFITQLKTLIDRSCLLPDEVIIATAEEHEEAEIDIASFFHYEGNGFLADDY